MTLHPVSPPAHPHLPRRIPSSKARATKNLTRGLFIPEPQELHTSLGPLGVPRELQRAVSLGCPDPTSAGGPPRWEAPLDGKPPPPFLSEIWHPS